MVLGSNLKALVCPFSRYTFSTLGRKSREFPCEENKNNLNLVGFRSKSLTGSRVALSVCNNVGNLKGVLQFLGL